MSRLSTIYRTGLRRVVLAFAALSGAGLVTMMVVTTLDVVLRRGGRPLLGALDIVSLAGAVTLIGALPYTTAVKGHVAIEYFFHKLSRSWRRRVDSAARLLVVILFGLMACQAVRYGNVLRQTGQTTPTLEAPLFWLPYLMAAASAVVALVVLDHLIHFGRELIKP